jgi:hypothetical protein
MTVKTFATLEELNEWLRRLKIPDDQAEAARKEFNKRKTQNEKARRRRR